MAFQIRLLLHAALYSLFSPSVDRSRHGQKNVSIFSRFDRLLNVDSHSLFCHVVDKSKSRRRTLSFSRRVAYTLTLT